MLRILDALAQQCYVPADYLPAVLAAGWHLSDLNRMVDDVLTRSETVRLREFRDGHHMEERAFNIQAVAGGPPEYPGGDQVHDETRPAGEQHDAALHLRNVPKVVVCLVERSKRR